MATLEKSVVVAAPLSEVFPLFTDFERFPEFMDGVERVERVGVDEVRWQARLSGKTEEWTARITEEVPGARIAWTGVAGAPNSGEVTFERLSEHLTRVGVRIDYEPRGVVENVGAWLGVVDNYVARALQRFQTLAEGRPESDGNAAAEVEPPPPPSSTPTRAGKQHQAEGNEEGSVEKVIPTDIMDGGQRRQARLEGDDRKVPDPEPR